MGYLRGMTTRIEYLARQRAWPLIRRYGFDVLAVFLRRRYPFAAPAANYLYCAGL